MAAQQVIVIGLGQFGMAVARALAANGEEVIAVDLREDRVQRASAFVLEALTMDAMDEEALAALRPARRDAVICAIGDDAREASIVVTALLRQMGVGHILARATDEVHERILRLVGAHEVFSPERIFGERLAAKMSNRGIVDTIPLGDDLVITELQAPTSFVGRRLDELALPERYGLTVLAIKRPGSSLGALTVPKASEALSEGDLLVLAGPPGASQRLTQEH